MMSNFVSADYGWLQLPDRAVEVQVYFKIRKACNEYFTNNDILEHATKAINILEDHFSHD